MPQFAPPTPRRADWFDPEEGVTFRRKLTEQQFLSFTELAEGPVRQVRERAEARGLDEDTTTSLVAQVSVYAMVVVSILEWTLWDGAQVLACDMDHVAQLEDRTQAWLLEQIMPLWPALARKEADKSPADVGAGAAVRGDELPG